MRVFSRRGSVVATARVTRRSSPGMIFADLPLYAEAAVNLLTNDAVDPTAKIQNTRCAGRYRKIYATCQ